MRNNQLGQLSQADQLGHKGRWIAIALVALFAVSLSACRHEKPNVIYMSEMVYSPAMKAQEPGANQPPVAGTVPRGYKPYAYATDPEQAGKSLKNPLRPTRAVLERGEHVFKTYCLVCHGPNGEGDGSIVPKFPRPPSLQSEKVRTWSDGRIYHVLTMGQNLMPSYASQIATGDRWAAIHYVRALQKSKHPTAQDIQFADEESK